MLSIVTVIMLSIVMVILISNLQNHFICRLIVEIFFVDIVTNHLKPVLESAMHLMGLHVMGSTTKWRLY